MSATLELPYALGHSDFELKRLATQARLINPMTRRFFTEAGIGRGMRVLDVGSGAGDVAIMLSELVGPQGSVVGTDMSAKALATATRRVAEAGVTNISFREGDPSWMRFDEQFDAIAGRYVLMFMQEPAAALARLSNCLKPGGIVVFHEVDWSSARSVPMSPLYDRCCALCAETLSRKGADTTMGPKLHRAFLTAGLNAPTMRLEAFIGTGQVAADGFRLISELAITLLPDMERLGLVAPGEIDPETLTARMLDEAIAARSVGIGRSEVGVWCRTDPAPNVPD